MLTTPFHFSSERLPSVKAKRLQAVFPFLKLSAAQELTARALGYADWYACQKQGTTGQPSLPDEATDQATRSARYVHQARALMQSGITPFDADRWVRAWGLTGQPTAAPQDSVPYYYRFADDLLMIDAGDLSEHELREMYGDTDTSKYPEIDRPMRVADGVILAPCGKYPHYALDHTLQLRVPIYLRGPRALYHIGDDHGILKHCIPGFPADNVYEDDLSYQLGNALRYEWHHDRPQHEDHGPVVPRIIAAALAVPEKLIAISLRATPQSGGRLDFGRPLVACLRGSDFAAFVRDKGELDPARVVWYPSSDVGIGLEFVDWISAPDGRRSVPLPILAERSGLPPRLPPYIYPFKHAPMHREEYATSMDTVALNPLPGYEQ